MYDNVKHLILSHNNDLITKARQDIILDILAGPSRDHYMKTWYSDNWLDQKYDYCDLILTEDNQLISLCGAKICKDNTLKVNCRYYLMSSFRVQYRSINQVKIIPKGVEYAKNLGLKGAWYSFHLFDKRHKRYSESQKKLINGGRVSPEFMPYWKSFKYIGIVEYNGVLQDKFYMDVSST